MTGENGYQQKMATGENGDWQKWQLVIIMTGKNGDWRNGKDKNGNW